MRVALTFDAEHPDRPHRPGVQEGILDVLRDRSVRATFFLQGRWVEAFPETARRVARGRATSSGSHSFYHARLPLLSDAGMATDIRDAEAAIRDIVGVDPRPWFRCPFLAGGDDPRVLGILAGLGYREVPSDVVLDDWEPARTGEAIAADALAAVAGGRRRRDRPVPHLAAPDPRRAAGDRRRPAGDGAAFVTVARPAGRALGRRGPMSGVSPAVLAVDVGNSKTDLALVAADGTVLGAVRGPSGSHQAVGFDRAIATLRRAGRRRRRRRPGLAADGIVAPIGAFCMAGVDTPRDERRLRRGPRPGRPRRRAHPAQRRLRDPPGRRPAGLGRGGRRRRRDERGGGRSDRPDRPVRRPRRHLGRLRGRRAGTPCARRSGAGTGAVRGRRSSGSCRPTSACAGRPT